MTDKEKFEYAEELVALANEHTTGVDPQLLIDLIQRRGEVTDADEQVAILQLAAELLHNQTQEQTQDEDKESEVAAETSGEEAAN